MTDPDPHAVDPGDEERHLPSDEPLWRAKPTGSSPWSSASPQADRAQGGLRAVLLAV